MVSGHLPGDRAGSAGWGTRDQARQGDGELKTDFAVASVGQRLTALGLAWLSGPGWVRRTPRRAGTGRAGRAFLPFSETKAFTCNEL